MGQEKTWKARVVDKKVICNSDFEVGISKSVNLKN